MKALKREEVGLSTYQESELLQGRFFRLCESSLLHPFPLRATSIHTMPNVYILHTSEVPPSYPLLDEARFVCYRANLAGNNTVDLRQSSSYRTKRTKRSFGSATPGQGTTTRPKFNLWDSKWTTSRLGSRALCRISRISYRLSLRARSRDD